MGKKDGLPNPIVKREVIYGDKNWNLSLRRCGDIAREKGALIDALMYYIKGECEEEIGELKEQAIKEGNTFLLRRIEDELKEDPDVEAWEKLMEKAKEKGKNAYAKRARKFLVEEGVLEPLEEESEEEGEGDEEEAGEEKE